MKKTKRIIALLTAIILVGLYATTLISAILIPQINATLFKISIFSTITLPIMLYAYILVYKLLKERGKELNSDIPKKEAE